LVKSYSKKKHFGKKLQQKETFWKKVTAKRNILKKSFSKKTFCYKFSQNSFLPKLFPKKFLKSFLILKLILLYKKYKMFELYNDLLELLSIKLFQKYSTIKTKFYVSQFINRQNKTQLINIIIKKVNYYDKNIYKFLKYSKTNYVLKYIYLWASSYGYYKIIKNLIKNNRVINYPEILFKLSRFGHYKIVKMLLKNKKVDPSINTNHAVNLSSTYNHYKITKLLLKDERVNAGDFRKRFNYSALEIASKCGYYRIVKLLLKNKYVNPCIHNSNALYVAFDNEHYKIVKLLLKNKYCNPGLKSNEILNHYIKIKNNKMVKKILNDRRINPCIKNNYPIELSVLKKNYKIMKLLLDYNTVRNGPLENTFDVLVINNSLKYIKLLLLRTNVDPGYKNNKSLIVSARFGYLEIIKFLINHPKIKPNCNINFIVHTAIIHNKIDVLKYLLGNSILKIDLSYENNKNIETACIYGYTNIVNLLLKYKEVDPYRTKSLVYAVKVKNIEIIKQLLYYETLYYEEAIMIAIHCNNIEIVKVLLNNKPLCISIYGSKMLYLAIYYNHPNIVKLLLKTKIKENISDVKTLNWAIEHNYYDIYKMLIDLKHIKPNNETMMLATNGKNPEIIETIMLSVF